MKTNLKMHFIVCVAVLSALAGVLMLIEFPLPIAPPFYKIDLSDVAALMGGFMFGPWAGLLICFLKVLISIILNGTTTAFVGEFAAFLMDGAFVFVTSLVFKKDSSFKGTIISLCLGVLTLMAVAAFANYYLMIPAYVKFMNFPLDAIIALGTAVNSRVNSLLGLVLLCTVPFNLIKGLIISILTYVLYRRIWPLIKNKD